MRERIRVDLARFLRFAPEQPLDDHVLASARARVDEPVVVEARPAELRAPPGAPERLLAAPGAAGSATLRARRKSRPRERARQTSQRPEIATASASGAGTRPISVRSAAERILISPPAITATRPSPSAGSRPGSATSSAAARG